MEWNNPPIHGSLFWDRSRILLKPFRCRLEYPFPCSPVFKHSFHGFFYHMHPGHSFLDFFLLQKSRQTWTSKLYWEVWRSTRRKQIKDALEQVVYCSLLGVLLRSPYRLHCVSYTSQQGPVGLAGNYDDDLCLHDPSSALVLASRIEFRSARWSDERMHNSPPRLLHDVLHWLCARTRDPQ